MYLFELSQIVNRIKPENNSVTSRISRNISLFFFPDELFVSNTYEFVWWKLINFQEDLNDKNENRKLTIKELSQLAKIISQHKHLIARHSSLYSAILMISVIIANHLLNGIFYSIDRQLVEEMPLDKIISLFAENSKNAEIQVRIFSERLQYKKIHGVNPAKIFLTVKEGAAPCAFSVVQCHPNSKLQPYGGNPRNREIKDDALLHTTSIQNFIILLDADACVFNLVFENLIDLRVREEETLNQALRNWYDHIISQLLTTSCKQIRVILVSNSARYDRHRDQFNCERNRTPSWFPTLEMIKHSLQKEFRIAGITADVELDKYLLCDTYGECKPGDNFDDPESEASAPFDESKLLLVYRHLHHYAARFEGEKTKLLIYDDRVDLLQSLINYFKKPAHNLVIPADMICAFYRFGTAGHPTDRSKTYFDGRIDYLTHLEGKEKIDRNWEVTIKRLPSYDLKKDESPNFIDILSGYQGDFLNNLGITSKPVKAAARPKQLPTKHASDDSSLSTSVRRMR